MTTPSLALLRPSRLSRRLAAAGLAGMTMLSMPPARAAAQIIQIKTLPIVDGQQWRLFPSANQGLGDVSIALRDSLLDPFVNPAKGSRLSEHTRGFFFGSPSLYSVSKKAGGGRTLPVGGLGRRGALFGGLAIAVQEIDNARELPAFTPVVNPVSSVPAPPPPVPLSPSHRNQFAFATLGRVFERAGIAVGASAQWSGLRYIDGVDLLYAGSQGINQHGQAMNVRLGMLKEWTGNRTFEAVALHDDFDVRHDVTWLDAFWDPNIRAFVQEPRVQRNLDHTKLWGLHLGYTQPFVSDAWRIGGIVTTNLMSHPKLPDYQVAQVMTIPWDPGHSAAYDLGIGISKVQGLTRFGLDVIYEPIRTHTWGEAPDVVITTFETRPAGAKTTENWFRFSNAIVRTGLSREIPMDSVRMSLKGIRGEFGVAMRSIDYTMDQTDHLARSDRTQRESWMEWTRTWGFVIRFTDLDVRYAGRTTTGTGRPGIVNTGIVFAPALSAGTNFLAPPSGPTTLTGVAVTTHQVSLSIPIR